ncbi:MAG: hypothetical protein QM651_04830 [Rhodoblastus sp.]
MMLFLSPSLREAKRRSNSSRHLGEGPLDGLLLSARNDGGRMQRGASLVKAGLRSARA